MKTNAKWYIFVGFKTFWKYMISFCFGFLIFYENRNGPVLDHKPIKSYGPLKIQYFDALYLLKYLSMRPESVRKRFAWQFCNEAALAEVLTILRSGKVMIDWKKIILILVKMIIDMKFSDPFLS